MLIDGDVVVYQIGFRADKDELGFTDTLGLLQEFIESLQELCREKEYTIILSPKSCNFREEIFSEYKKNRNSKHKPLFYEDIRSALIEKWGAIVTVGQEADDAMGLMQTDTTIICSIDKDLNMVPGWHYNWRKPEEGLVWVGELEAFKFFMLQCLTGDSVDNIPGLYKIAKRKAMPKVKEPLDDPRMTTKGMWEYIKEVYTKEHYDALFLTSKLLWIRHTYNTEGWMNEVWN